MRFKKRYGVIKEDKQKNNGDWVFDSPTDRCFFEITAKNEREFDIFAEEIKSHGYEPSLCPSVEDNEYSDCFYIFKEDKKDFLESYKTVTDSLKKQ